MVGLVEDLPAVGEWGESVMFTCSLIVLIIIVTATVVLQKNVAGVYISPFL